MARLEIRVGRVFDVLDGFLILLISISSHSQKNASGIIEPAVLGFWKGEQDRNEKNFARISFRL